MIPLVGIGVILLAGSLYLVGRDAAFARSEAEAEVVALAETSATAVQLVPANRIDGYVTDLLKHPAVATVTVYSATGERMTRTRPAAAEPPFIGAILPSFREPIVGCRAVGDQTVCLEGDPAYYEGRLSALIVPHVIVLAAAAVLLLVAMILARGSGGARIQELTRIVRAAAEQNDYSRRTTTGKGRVGALAGAINTLLEQMHQRDLILRRRTTELESVNKELESFSYSVSHDLRSPLASVDGFTQALSESCADRLDESEREYLRWIQDGIEQMKNLVAGLLQMSRISRSELNRAPVDLSALAESIAQSLRQRDPSRTVDFRIAPGLVTEGDERLLHAVLENLLSNAYKFTGKTEEPVIEVGATSEGGQRTYFVRDNGAGFDSTQAAKMFTPFQRLHSSSEFEGTGIGLATVKRIIEKHGGVIWADGEVGQGATFYFTLLEPAGVATGAELAGASRA